MKIVTIVGARPQFVKAACLSRELAKYPDQFNEILVHTGQHFDQNMSEIFFDEMQIPKPQYNLNINGLGHGAMTGQMLQGIEEICIQEKPDWVLVYGDTNSTLAGALAAKKLHIKVAHIEAGLRSFNMRMPEEINRILTDRISDLLFCPTEQAVTNLTHEGLSGQQVVLNGDIMMDAALYYSQQSNERSLIIEKLQLSPGKFVLATVHRQENTDDSQRLREIFYALQEIQSSGTRVILPIHPRTKKILVQLGVHTSVELIDPVGYFDMIELIKNATLVMTDSGGLQKEAYFFNKFCITLRDETEWVELVENNFNRLVGADKEEILQAFLDLKYKTFDRTIELYGGGCAAEKIREVLENY
jgi:UDP-GlcNAc3NAcA epimerase